MNRRILKKRCKHARDVLIRDYAYRLSDFDPARGEETIDAPARMEGRSVCHGSLDPGPLPGTPLIWEGDPVYGEGDYRRPDYVLADLIAWSTFREPRCE